MQGYQTLVLIISGNLAFVPAVFSHWNTFLHPLYPFHAIFASAFILLVLAYFLFKIYFTSRAYHGPNRKMFFIFLL